MFIAFRLLASTISGISANAWEKLIVTNWEDELTTNWEDIL